MITEDEFGICAVKKDLLYKNGLPSIFNAVDKTKYAIKQFRKIWKYEYRYNQFKYITSICKSIVTCKVHGNFEVNHHNHSQGKGCPDCGRIRACENGLGWSYSNWEKAAEKSKNFDSYKLYILKCWNDEEEFYKIGKTFTKMCRRYTPKKFPYNFEIILIIEDDEANKISQLESKLKRVHKKYKYVPNMHFGGKQECFTKIIDINNGKEIS